MAQEALQTPSPAQPAPPVYWQVPKLAEDDRLVAGVAAGIATEIGLAPMWIRLSFVVLFAIGGWGALFYGIAWATMAVVAPRQQRQPPVPKARSARSRKFGTGLVFGGLVVGAIGAGGFPSHVVWPLGLAGAGVVVAWQRLTAALDATRGPWWRWVVAAAGLMAATVGLSVLAGEVINRAGGLGPEVVTLGVVLALAVLSAPWWWRLVRERDAERQARVRSEERADLAAHLHDSVLQTLSLIQRNSEDPHRMLNLARRQERELRNWLDPDRVSRQGGSVRGQLDDIATAVEELHGVPVEVVAVGDCIVGERIEALLGATREATVNSAKHAGAERIDVYAEVTDDAIEIYVRDTGKGFDLETVADDRRGLLHSILGRMDRVGGSAVITSAPGEGTEVELRLGMDQGQ